ncbi:hypothetical protein EBT31_01305 [bacterium]|nr:hypothetical protein [bacterium]NBX48842.1 hypothetical protein [bacterium]
MKTSSAAERFFNPHFLPQTGVLLAGVRVAFAWVLVKDFLSLHAAMPEVLGRLKVQAVPFLEAFATVWNMAFWYGVIIVAGVLFAGGMFTRTAALVLLMFFLGVLAIDHRLVSEIMGAWWMVSILLLGIAFISRWGCVFGIDDIMDRLQIGKEKIRRKSVVR